MSLNLAVALRHPPVQIDCERWSTRPFPVARSCSRRGATGRLKRRCRSRRRRCPIHRCRSSISRSAVRSHSRATRAATSTTPASASRRTSRVPASFACRSPRPKKTPSTPSIAMKLRSVKSRKRSRRSTSSCSITRRRWRFSIAIRRSCRQIQQIAETRYRLGQGLQQDLIKAQLQTTEILKEHAMHHQEEDQAQLELKQILGRDPDSPNIDIGEVEATHLQLDSSQLAQLSRQRFPRPRRGSRDGSAQRGSIEACASGLLAGLHRRLLVPKDRPRIPRLLHAESGREGSALFLAQANARDRAGRA